MVQQVRLPAAVRAPDGAAGATDRSPDLATTGEGGDPLKHVHRLQPRWILQTGIADSDHWYRIVLWARCTVCGMEGAFAAEQSRNHAEGRLLEPGE